MIRNLSFAVALALVISFLGIGACMTPPPPTPENAETAATYEAEQLLCVDTAKTREESHTCRCEVRKRYNRSCDGLGVTP